MRSRKGFTLIELMIVVAIVGVLAAIAIPAYLDYIKRSHMTEVLSALDAIATGAGEYHAVLGYFPLQSYGTNNLASFSDSYANIVLHNLSDRNFNMAVAANFRSTLNLESATVGDYGKLTMQLTYDTQLGYQRRWALVSPSTTIDAIFMPRK